MSDAVGTLLSVNVGLPKDVTWRGKTVFTGVFKDAVGGPRRVRRLNVDGDGQGDLAGHGGEQRAVFVYQIDSYRYWERELDRNDFIYGQFGENFTVDGLTDDEVCIGDRYQIGTAVFEVTQPRVTCYRVGLRMDDPRIPALLVSGSPLENGAACRLAARRASSSFSFNWSRSCLSRSLSFSRRSLSRRSSSFSRRSFSTSCSSSLICFRAVSQGTFIQLTIPETKGFAQRVVKKS